MHKIIILHSIVAIYYNEMLTSFSSVLTIFVGIHLELWSPVRLDRLQPRRQHRSQFLAVLLLLLPSRQVASVMCSAFDDSLLKEKLANVTSYIDLAY